MEKQKSTSKTRKSSKVKGQKWTSKAAARKMNRSAKTGRFVSKAHRRSTSGSTPPLTPASGGFGCARNLIHIGPDFDEPIDDFEAYT